MRLREAIHMLPVYRLYNVGRRQGGLAKRRVRKALKRPKPSPPPIGSKAPYPTSVNDLTSDRLK